ncbi:hypothetical protein OJE16_09550 [Pantoea tagorei]|uniref:hypothetical protein n=1 Tax=Enterobacterales TaxID=91347 RepID=UPI0015E177EA|nr:MULTISPECIES: hypothetical protein [Enterobacterales]UBN56152.1 hypothetical protein LB453_11705 [Pantoea agglomerans]
MERNAHRLTLHSPAEQILPLLHDRVIDLDQLSFLFCPLRRIIALPLTFTTF